MHGTGPQLSTLGQAESKNATVGHQRCPQHSVHYQASPWGSHARSVWERGGVQPARGQGHPSSLLAFNIKDLG